MTEETGVEPGTGRTTSDRRAGLVTLVVAVAIGLDALSFSTTFPTDPLGPKAFPLVAAVLLASGGAWVLFRPGARSTAPLPGAVWIASASFILYALLLEPLGFFVSTLLEFVGLAMLFGGPPLRSTIAGAAFVGALYVLFVHGLGLVLPVGSLFAIGG